VDPALLAEHRVELPLDFPGRQERLAKIADGVAYCAVRKPHHEVFWVTVNLRQNEIVILLPGDCSVNTTNIQHVSEVWECLVQISGVVDQQTGEPRDTEQISPETTHELSEIEPVRRLQSLSIMLCKI